MIEPGDWEGWLAEEFPGFLLPSSLHKSISLDVAARFLARLGRQDHLRVLQGAAAFSPPEVAEALRAFVHDLVPRLVQVLPCQTEVYERRWQEGYHGRLDVRATLAERLAGNPSTFVTRARRRNFDLPETVLLKHVLRRLRRELVRLRDAELIPGALWSLPIDGCEHQIDQLLQGTALRHVSDRAVESADVVAARSAQDPAFRAAALWFDRLRIAFDAPDETATAALIARGALSPESAATRFEIAVVLRLLGAVWIRLCVAQPHRWTLDQGLIHAKRRDLAMLRRDDGATIEFYYNQTVLPVGPRDSGAAYYFGTMGRLRPDWTVAVTLPSRLTSYVVGEVKHSSRGSYERTGFSEAVLYRFEYGASLAGWLKSVLVVPGHVAGVARMGDPTIAVGWASWVPDVVVDGVLDGVLESSNAHLA